MLHFLHTPQALGARGIIVEDVLLKSVKLPDQLTRVRDLCLFALLRCLLKTRGVGNRPHAQGRMPASHPQPWARMCGVLSVVKFDLTCEMRTCASATSAFLRILIITGS